MTQKGKVELKGQIIVDDTLIWLSKDGSSNWSGHFSVPSTISNEEWAEIHKNKREFCELTLEDGTSGEIIINPQYMPPYKIYFMVIGGLTLRKEEDPTNE